MPRTVTLATFAEVPPAQQLEHVKTKIIRRFVRQHNAWLSQVELARPLHAEHRAHLPAALSELVTAGQLVVDGDGRYQLPSV
jgi:hypothetical protein